MATTTVDAADIRMAAYGTRIPADADPAITRLIQKAMQRITEEVPNLDARMSAELVAQATLDDIVEDMVVRVVKNPNGYRQVGIDDFQATIDTTLSSGGLYLSEEERIRLAGKPKRRRIGSARLNLPIWRQPGV